MQGFSNSPHFHSFNHLSFDLSMPMPFKIPIVFQTFLHPDTDLDFTAEQRDFVEALRFSLSCKRKNVCKGK